jgi:hypothetical protein
MIHRETAKAQIGRAGVQFAEILTDPFGQAEGGWMSVRGNLPDGLDGVVKLTQYATMTLSGAVATSYIITTAISTTQGMEIDATYGAEASDDTATMTSITYTTTESKAIADSIIANFSTDVRHISTGIRVTTQSSADSSAGSMLPYLTNRFTRTAAATYKQNQYLTNNQAGPAHSVIHGIVVRAPLRENTFRPIRANVFDDIIFEDGRLMPLVVVTGLSATTVLRVECIMHYETRVSSDAMPIPMEIQPFEPEWRQLAYHCNREPMATTANSFKGFIKGLWKGLKSAFHVAEKVIPLAKPILSAF